MHCLRNKNTLRSSLLCFFDGNFKCYYFQAICIQQQHQHQQKKNTVTESISNKGVKTNCVFIAQSHLHGELSIAIHNARFTNVTIVNGYWLFEWKYHKCLDDKYIRAAALLLYWVGTFFRIVDNHLIEMYSPFIKYTWW